MSMSGKEALSSRVIKAINETASPRGQVFGRKGIVIFATIVAVLAYIISLFYSGSEAFLRH